MTELIRTYLIRITVAAMIGGAACALCTAEHVKRIVRLCSGLCIILLVISPLLKIDMDQMQLEFESIETNADQYTTQAADAMYNQSAAIIKQKTQAYILDKATACHAQITVEVQTSELETAYCYPSGVRLTGDVTPEQQLELTRYIVDTLGIAEDQIQWENGP